MAKRKKAATKPVATRRTTRRGKQAASEAAAAATDGETSTAAEPSTSQTTPKSPVNDTDSTTTGENSVPQPETSGISNLPVMKPCQVPIVALHKKFGKYRCLFNNEEGFTRKYEVGSDSETNSSVEIRVVDPCASSESDSNAALDTQSDTNSGICLSPMNSTITPIQNNSRDISPVSMLHEMPQICEIPLLGNNIEVDLKSKEKDVAVSETLEPIEHQEPIMQKLNNEPQLECKDDLALEDVANEIEEIPVNQDIPFEDQIEFAGDDDDEVITIVQIVEDDYYTIKIDSPKDELLDEHQDTVNEDLGNKSTETSDFQKHFEQLNIESVVISDSSMECSDIIDIRTPPCSTPDIPFPKENFCEALMRPDPSLTPSSTLSDDSNSSRITEQNQNNSNDSAESSPTGVRRSNRIKTISNMKQKTKGYGLVKTPLKKALITQTKLKLEELGSDSQEKSCDMILSNAPNSPSFPVPSDMPVKVKSRWRRSSELEMGANSPANSPLASPSLPQRLPPISEMNSHLDEDCSVIPMSKETYDRIIDERMNQYQHLEENEYLCERMISKETKKMICDCFMTKEELERGELACGEDCLNRLLMIECNSRCPVGDRCTNRRFQKCEIASLKVFYADKKGCGVESAVDIPTGEFLMEYVGEVLDYEQFYKRAQTYSDENNMHHYFMSLKGDTVIDATLKGNISRFINHSCDPNAETQKWTVNGELRIGFFSKRDIVSGEEITFDYQFQRFGKVAQRCYCGADNCRGWIGAEPDSDDEDDEEEEEDVSTSKSGTTESSEECQETPTETPRPRPRRPKRERKYKPKAPDLVQDADIEEDLEALSRTGVKNQSHTLRLSRTVVRAKTRRAQTALLRLLRDSDLPCRRLFLDYRGLRLLAPWCTDAPLDFRLEMLQTVDRLPIPNKTMVQESRFFTIVERWLSSADTIADTVFIDENTGLPVDLPNRGSQENLSSPEKIKDNSAIIDKVKDLSNQLLERWSSLKEVFKIPKKERIQQMKEHERQANVERRAADSSGTRDRDRKEDRDRDREREREREKERDRDRERERERERERDRSDRDRDRDRHRERERDRDRDRDRDDRDRRKRRSSPEGRRSIRLSERVLAAVPPMSKEERRRAFAEAAAVADETRRQRDARDPRDPRDARDPRESRDQRDARDINSHWPHYWPQHDAHAFQQMFPPGMLAGAGNMLPLPAGVPPGMLGIMPDAPPDWLTATPEFQATAFCPPFGGPQTFCMPQPNMMGMGGFNMGGFMFGQQMAGAPPFPHPPHPHQPHPHPHPQLQPHPQQPQAQPQLPQLDMQLQVPQVPADGKEPAVPSMWRSARDARGRTYYYHVKQRRPQWLPPPMPPPQLSNSPDESSSEEEEEQPSALDSPIVRRHVKGKLVEGFDGIYEVIKADPHKNGLIPDHALVNVKPRKRRPGLVSERPISPRTEEDKLAGRLEVKRYRQTKEKLRRRREKLLQRVRQLATAKHRKPRVPVPPPTQNTVDVIDSESDTDEETEEILTEKPIESPPVSSPVVTAPGATVASVETGAPVATVAPVAAVAPVVVEAEVKEDVEVEVDAEDAARRIKEQFRSSMARVMVHHLNPYRHSDALAGRITCTSDFKHLARKLTHFVMLKELKHCRSVDELIVTDSVRSKAKMFVKKYMAKFGPVYKRPPEEAD